MSGRLLLKSYQTVLSLQSAVQARNVCPRCLNTLTQSRRTVNELNPKRQLFLGSLDTKPHLNQAVHTSCVLQKGKWTNHKKKQKKQEAPVPPEDEQDDDDDFTTSPEEERDRIVYLVQERLAATVRKGSRISGTLHYRPEIVKVVNVLQIQKFRSKDIIEIASQIPVLESPISELTDFVKKLQLEGFSTKLIGAVLMYNARVVKLKGTDVDQLLNALRSFIGTNELILHVIGGNPRILLTEPRRLIDRYNKLMILFQKSEVLELIGRIPDILTCAWSDIEEKVEYVVDEMGLDHKNIVKTNVLSHSMQHIITRHTFLKRAGLFERPNKHGVTSINNPTLKQIVDSDDTHFAPLYGAGMKPREYAAFWKMLELEMEEENEEDFTDEEDLDEDNDDLESR